MLFLRGKNDPLGSHIFVDTFLIQCKVFFGDNNHMTGDNSVIQPVWHHAPSKYYHPELFSPAEFLYLAAQLIAVNSVYVVYHDCNGSSAFIGDNRQVTAVLSAWNIYIYPF